MKLLRNSKMQTAVVIILALLVLSSFGGVGFLFSVSDLGYSSAFQGPKAKFCGAEYDGQKYTDAPNRFDKVLAFDADAANGGKPDVKGEMTTIFVPESSLQYATWQSFPEWTSWLKDNDRITNPKETYAWNISGKIYKMEQWIMKFYVALSSEWQDQEDLYPNPLSDLDPTDLGKTASNVYEGLSIWLEFDVTPTWYIEGGGTAYFAIASAQLAQPVKYQGQDMSGAAVEADSMVSVYPELESSALYLYYAKFGTQSAEASAYTFEGKKLNPAIFVNKVYAHLDLSNFGVRGWNSGFAVSHKGDVAVFDFDIRVFVIGEWNVKDIQEPPIDYVPIVSKTSNLSLMDYLADPKVQALLTLLAMGVFLLLILLVAPGFLIALVAIFAGRRRK